MRKSAPQFCFSYSGEDIYLFTLTNSKGTAVCISNYGATITSFSIIQKKGTSNNIVLGFNDVEQYRSEKYLEAYPFFGAAIGRYGNRIKSGTFQLDGKEYVLAKNLAPDHLHGGNIGFDRRAWKCGEYSSGSLVLSYFSPDGEEGYPGNLFITIRFELTEENELSYTYSAITDKATPVNLTHHSYFNLDNGEGNIGNTLLKINSASILEQDEHLAATGKLIDIKNSGFDFRQLKRINADWIAGKGYDQSFLLDTVNPSVAAAEAYSEKSGLLLQVFTTEPVVHFYTGSGIPPIPGYNGKHYEAFSGFCLETQVHPNAINIPSFPDTVLRPGQTYHQKTVYRIREENPINTFNFLSLRSK
jgi:aldose 1-epimerase